MFGEKDERRFIRRVNFKNHKKRKTTITFDEEQRKEFLSGFHKRKLERKEKAKQKLEEELKSEKKRLKQEARERYRAMLYKRPQIEMEEFLNKDEFETENHKVSILELDVSKLDPNHIGENKMRYEDSETEEPNEQMPDTDTESELSGFEVKPKKKKNRKGQVPEAESLVNQAPGSKKELKKALKMAAMKELSTSAVFKRKTRIEKQKNRHKSKVEKMRKNKMKKEKGKKKGKRK